MQGLCRRKLLYFLIAVGFLAAGTSLKAYPVSITINATFSDIPGDMDQAGFGMASPPTAVITTTVESSAPAGSYPVTVSLTVPAFGITNRMESGSLTINTNGQIGATFSDSQGSFTAVLVLQGVTFPSPVPTSFGTASFSSPASTVSYDLLGATGTVGVTGTVTATGLTASPTTPISVSYQLGGTAPAPKTISIGSNGSPTGYTVAILPGTSQSSTGFLTLSTSAGTTPGSVVASFSTAVAAGTYTAEIAINTSSDSTGAPITIPVTYTVTPPVESGSFTASPTSLAFTYTSGGTSPKPQTIALTSSASPAPSFTATSSVPWATVTSSSATTPATLTVSVNPSSLAVGGYSGTINIASTAGNLAIPIGITVAAAGGGSGSGGLTISPGTLSFTFFVPGSTTQSQTVQVTTSTNAATYTAAVGSGSFLSVSPASGLIPGAVTVTANTTGLGQGTFAGSIVFTSPGQASVTLPVSITNGSSGAPNTVSLSPKFVALSYVLGGAVPAPVVVQVTDPSTVGFTVTSASFYLPVTPASGTTPGSFTISLDTSGLAAGVYQDNIAVSPSLGFGATLPVTLTVTAPAAAVPTATPASLTFVSPATAASPLTQTVSISENAATTFSISVPWLSATSAISGANTILTVIANPAGLAPGTYTTTIAVTAPAKLSIPVTLTVAAPATPTLAAVPASVAFAYQTGGTAPPAQTVTLSAVPTGPYTVTGYGAWIDVVVSADSTTATISVNTAGLSPGVYVTAVKVDGAGFGNSPLFIPVTLTVSPSPTFGVSPVSLTFNYQPNGAVPAPQTVAVASSSGSNFTTATADSPWIVVVPSPPGSLTVSVIPGSMANGTYHGNITVAGGASAPTATIPVTLNIDSVAIPVLSAVTNGISFENNIGAPGLIVSLWGTGLGPAAASPLQLANATTVATTNAGTQVFANGIPCPILFSSAQQVNAILPFALQGATTAQVTLTYNGAMSNAVTIPVQPSAPSLFSLSATGQGGGAILNQDLSVNSVSNPAAAGTIIAIFGGGGGATNPPGSDGLLVPITTTFPAPVLPGSITIGGQTAQLVYYGDAPELVSGVLQFNAVIPAGTASGPQPIVVSIGTVSSQPDIVVYVK